MRTSAELVQLWFHSPDTPALSPFLHEALGAARQHVKVWGQKGLEPGCRSAWRVAVLVPELWGSTDWASKCLED